VSRKILNSINSLVDEDSSVNKLLKLTERELDFLKLACSEKNYAQIAKEMFVSERTIDGYRDALFKKLNISTRVAWLFTPLKMELLFCKFILNLLYQTCQQFEYHLIVLVYLPTLPVLLYRAQIL